MTVTPTAPTLRLVSKWHMGEWKMLHDTTGTDPREMLASIYPDISDYNLDKAVAEFAASSEYAGARIAGYAWSWSYLVPITDTRDAVDIIGDANEVRYGSR